MKEKEFDKKRKGEIINDISSVYPKGLRLTGNYTKKGKVTWMEAEDLATGKLVEVME